MTTLGVLYDTSPTGAMLYEGDKQLGRAPVIYYYRMPEEQIYTCYENGKSMMLNIITARWVSGALTTEIPAVTLNRTNFHGINDWRYAVTICRPIDVPGVEIDAQYGIEIEKLQAERRRYHHDDDNSGFFWFFSIRRTTK
jgi:hypothetical protein